MLALARWLCMVSGSSAGKLDSNLASAIPSHVELSRTCGLVQAHVERGAANPVNISRWIQENNV
jgi:hypothetical protein